MRLDITETTIGLQRFDAREGLDPKQYGWGGWLNKLNLQLGWGKWTVGTRVDSSLYWLRPIDRSFCESGCRFSPQEAPALATIDSASYRNSVYLAKAWVTYKAPGVEITGGDAYAQLGRGLVLSMRKIDELGIDTTVRGAKISIQKDPVAVQLLAGVANPARVDEATGSALFKTKAIDDDPRSVRPLFGTDLVVGGEIAAGRGGPVIAATRMAHFVRCAPYGYRSDGTLDASFGSTLFGSCAGADRDTWLSGLSGALNPLLRARNITQVGQSFEVPNLWGHGNLYIEGAIQDRSIEGETDPNQKQGNALYGSLVNNFGPVTTTLEMKSYRNYYAIPAAVDASRAVPFTTVQYSNLPTTELLIQDSMFGFFNACVNGGRLRTDVRLTPGFLVYGTAGYYYSKSELSAGRCDRFGRTVDSGGGPDGTHTRVYDGQTGVEWRFDKDRSQVLFSLGVRNDRFARTDNPFYNERSLNYSISIFLKGPFSFELYGRHRIRYQESENLRGPDGAIREVPWAQGFHTTALKIAPKWVFAQGIEYYTLLGQPATYLNGQLLYRFTSESNVKVLVGQQQGGLRCISGVCRVFPAFEGVRAELTLRF